MADVAFWTIVGTVIFSGIGFYLPLHYRKRNLAAAGMTQLIRMIDGKRFRDARNTLHKKYDQGGDVEDKDVKKQSEQIRKDLTCLEAIMDTKFVNRDKVFSLYSDIILDSMELYKKYLKEYEPEFSDTLNPALRILEDDCKQNLSKGKSQKTVDVFGGVRSSR